MARPESHEQEQVIDTLPLCLSRGERGRRHGPHFE